MREILFRGFHERGTGKDKIFLNGEWIQGEWVQGYLFTIWEEAYILWGMTNCIPDMTEVIPETVGQYTGLKDKNGKKIFEGDIVQDNIIFGEVAWDDKTASFIIDDIQDGYQGYSDWIHKIEVIGNIHSNPELLEVNK